MPLPRLGIAGAMLVAVTPPALADAVTYTGTLGKTEIVVEFSSPVEDAAEPFAGRYFYKSRGIDIPLNAVLVHPGVIDMSEEAPCSQALCEQPGGDTTQTPPLDASWHLSAQRDGAVLAGSWTDANDKRLPIRLTRVGSRAFAFDGEVDMLGFATPTGGTEESSFNMEHSAYDFLRMEMKPKLGQPIRWDEVAFRYATDPRTKFAFPRVTDLGGEDIAPLNDALERRHRDMNYEALDCARQAYAGFGWNTIVDGAPETMGGYEDETVEVTYLSPTIMSWTESGSIFCGGAHPWNHHEFHNLDAQSGEPLDLSLVFSGWHVEGTDLEEARLDIANHVWGPDEALADYVRAHRVPSGDADLEAECGYDYLIGSNLVIGFKRPDHVLFSLGELPNAAEACGYDLYEAPIRALTELLAPTVKEYFPELE